MDFKSIIKEQREELEQIEKNENIIPRDGLERTAPLLKFPNVLAILGVRRCGKSIFAYLAAKSRKFAYINFDDERLVSIVAEDLNNILEAFYELYGDVEFVILDEIQNVEHWQLFVNRLRRTKKVIITGSNSKLLSGELATHLTGRHIELRLFPFSFREFLRFRGFRESAAYTTKERSEILKFLQEYLEIGGFPEAYKFGKVMPTRIYEDIITKDILLRHKLQKVDELKKLAKYLITNSAQELSYSKLAQILSIKHISTISKWIRYLEDAFLVFKLERFDFKLKQQFIAPKKVYCIDSGLVNAIGFKFSEDAGKIIENEVALELQRRASANNKTEIFYWKDHKQSEVDFVVKSGKSISQLIQVTYAKSRGDIREREISSLLKAGIRLRCKNLLVLTWNYEAAVSIKGRKIVFTPLWKWLIVK